MRSLNLVFKRSEWSGGARFVRCRVISRGYVAILPGCGVALLPACPVDLRCPGCSVVEYPGKVACPSGRRCSTRNAVWCHSHPGFKSQRYRRCRPAPMGPGGFVIPEWCVRACCLLRRWCFGRRRARPPARLGVLTSFGAAPRSPPGPSGALHGCVAAKEPRFCLLIGGIALFREALHCLVASTLLAYLVHRFLKQHIPAHAHGYADRLLLHG